MKKLLFMAAALLTAGFASAQITYSIGYLNSTQDFDYPILSPKDMTYSGFSIGVDDNINLAGDLNVAPGIGMEFSFDKDDDKKYKEFALFVPVDFNYGFAISDNFKLSVFAGPTFNLGLMQKTTGDNDYELNYHDEDEGNMGRFDILLGGGIWCDIQDQFRIKVGYKAGMLNTCKTDDCTRKTNVLSVSFGYIF